MYRDRERARKRIKTVQSEILIDSEKRCGEPDKWNTGDGAGGVSRCERKEKDEYKEEGEMKAQERRDREIWQGGQLSFIKSIRYEPQSVSPGDVVWFVFFSPHHTLTQRHTHTHLLIYSELSVEAKAVNLEQTSKKQSYWAFWYIKVIVYLAHNPKLI